MNTFVRLFILTLHFAHTRGDIDVYELRADRDHSPLAVVRQGGLKSTVELAEPSEVQEKYTRFAVPKNQDFILACPRYLGCWKERIKRFFTCNSKEDDAGILFVKSLVDKNTSCERSLKPAVTLSGWNYCYKDGEIQTGEEYAIGYDVYEYDQDEGQHDSYPVTIFFACHSTLLGLHYTTYTLRSLNLLIANPYKKVKKGNLSRLGKNTPIGKLYEGKRKRYQIQSHYDMPPSVRSWKLTTFFDFNIIKVPGRKVFEYLTMVDNYIRMSVVKMDRQITIYSGYHTTTLTNLKDQSDLIKRGEERIRSIGQSIDVQQQQISEKRNTTDEAEYTFIWKILRDVGPESSSAIVIITLIDPFEKCTEICNNISGETNWKYFTAPRPGSCTYTCEVDGTINTIFGLAHLQRIPNKLYNMMKVNASDLRKYNDNLFSESEDDSENHFTDSIESADDNSSDDETNEVR